jgi:hypothetical protein
MLRRRNNRQRGYSLAELLSGMFVLALISTFVVIIMLPLMSAPNIQQAKIDTVQTGSMALYRLQRDIREGQVNGVYACSYPGPSICLTPSTAPTLGSVQALAILTARLNGNDYSVLSNTGWPSWQGFQVYWLVPDGSANGTYNLMYAFHQSNGFLPGSLASGADTAVTAALQSNSATTVARNILSLNIDQDANSKTIGASVSVQSTVDGKVNETTYQGDSFARN